MGLFSAHRRPFRPARPRTPIRLNPEFSLTRATRAALSNISKLALSATNDARVVTVLLLLAAAALAVEMAASFK